MPAKSRTFPCMTETDILIVGAGASGLMAARELARAGKRVCVLEARERIGGRIHTIDQPGFDFPLETGAEFIHGKLPLSLALVKEYGLSLAVAGGGFWTAEDGNFYTSETRLEGADLLEMALKQLEEDLPLDTFLDTYLGAPEHAHLREEARRFARGYDASDTSRASTLAFREEWLAPDTDEQYRIRGGYRELIQALADDIMRHAGEIRTGTVVKTINRAPGEVTVTDQHGHTHRARQLLLTIPLGVWQSPPEAEAHIRFQPPLTEKTEAANRLGNGHVIKFLFRFEEAFWMSALPGPAAFLFSAESVPTWWTPYPDPDPLLTGWLAGPPAEELRHTNEETLLALATDSLQQIFPQVPGLRNKLRARHIARWDTDPFALGAYSYAVTGGERDKKILAAPVADTLFFAGEALHTGGTVEAALQSGRETALLMLAVEAP